MNLIPAELIKKKRRGEVHSSEEIAFLIDEYTAGRLPDYQMSAWCMAVCFQGMDESEIAALTLKMKNSGHVMNFSNLPQRIDKHSTGGVGDKTTLILGPIAAAAGAHVPMIAGRGLGHTGGTLDKLESLPGFNVNLNESEFYEHVTHHKLAIMGQTKNLCPADRKLYALRDVTGTVDSLPLICSSIMSKKMAEDLTGLVLDVKYGSGAFMKTADEAEQLAQLLKTTGERNGIRTSALITSMNQPLGRYIGNSLEVKECVDIMSGETCIENGYDFYEDTRELSLILSGHMIFLADLAPSPEKGYALAKNILNSGQALDEFIKLCQRQGARRHEPTGPARHKLALVCESSGVLTQIHTENLGMASVQLGAGRLKTSDKIDHGAGIEMTCRLGQHINKGDVLAYLYCNHTERAESVITTALSAFKIENNLEKDFAPAPLVAKIL